MPNINIVIRNKIAREVDGNHIVCGNSDYTAVFDFDAEWEKYDTKTARFIWGDKYADVIFSGNTCPFPVIVNAFGVLVGVYAGDLHTTTAAVIDTEKSILCKNGIPADPPPDVYAQIMDLLNNSGGGGKGDPGKSAYEIAVENGFTGTAAEWLASLVGSPGNPGKSAYEIAVENGFTGTAAEWLASLVGSPGNPGKSAYEIAVENGFTGTAAEWLASLVGSPGDPGKSAYEIAVKNGFEGTEKEWLASLEGSPGTVYVEPEEDDIPKVFFGDDLPQTKTDTIMSFRYISKTDDISGYCITKAQGNSSMSYPKKNQTVKLYSDADCTEKLKVDFKGWGKQNKYCFKANWIDLSHSRNVVSARLWADVVKSRVNYEGLPEELRTSPNQGAVDGFPVKVYAAGVYQGRYTLNIPKDKWMTNMDDTLDKHCILCGENYVSGCFRASANINGTDWTDEIHDTVPDTIKTRWNEVISFVMNSTDEEFKAGLSDYFYVDSLIDYHLFGLQSCGLDAYGKNQIYATYDGQKWIASMYDMDSTWGLYWNGSSFVATDYGRDEYEDMISGRSGNLLYIRLEELFWTELQTRWAELKNGALSIENIINRFERFTDITPADLVKEDYASTTGGGSFTGIPSQSTNNIQQIRAYALARQAWCDEYIAGLTPVEEVSCTGISLSAETLTFTGTGTQTLTAIVEPVGCTDPVTWESSDTSIATVSGGVVTAVGNGNATITAKCGSQSVSCNVTVEGISEWSGVNTDECLYALQESTTFNGSSDYIDTGVKLFDEEKDFTILFNADLTQTNGNKSSLFHCINESNPWPGLCFNRYSSGYVVGGYYTGNYYYNGTDYIPTSTTKVAIQVTQGIVTNIRYYNENSIVVVTLPTDCTYAQVDKNLLLGCYQTSNGGKGRYWAGTINEFYVVNRAMSENEMDEFLQA